MKKLKSAYYRFFSRGPPAYSCKLKTMKEAFY